MMPLVKDGVASDDSIVIVTEHIKRCKSCKAEFDIFKSNSVEQTSIKDEKVIFAIKRSIFITQLTVLVVGAIIGVALSNSMGMFYNLLIMPIIGGASLAVFKRKWYLAPTAIFLLTYLWQTVTGIISGGFEWIALYSGLYFSLIYTVLVGLGVIIAMLLKFAFRKER
ncbi:zf-HC2 domain-containing protein [Clostridium sp. D2Q-11]|uniref:Zf-HC2 domain-containing protein n=1 Tax=Anaeromonas frigoriresistens TaxID=2683708 RepID=A0A942V1H9_9FIRM|nr:zf-HC2 domain-containing protein [Anaeromonas frigoriresistens]MBS4539457.1 zf-HC2 domain-containing protein [Anaeromonas frigoriresistens]